MSNSESDVRGRDSHSQSAKRSKSIWQKPELVIDYLYDAKTLYELVDPKDPEGLQKLGGVEGLAEHLKSDLDDGLTTSEEQVAHAEMKRTRSRTQSMDAKSPPGRRARRPSEVSSGSSHSRGPSNPPSLRAGATNPDGIDLLEQSRLMYGANRLPPAEFKTLWELVLEALKDTTLIMLMVSAAISLTVGVATEGISGIKDGVAVLVAVAVVVAITSLNDYQKERQFRKLNEVKNDVDVSVVRNGVKQTVSVYDLVVGDVVMLKGGDIIPADGVFVSGADLVADESASTGESKTIHKGPAPDLDPFFLSGTQISEGTGYMLVIAVGELSYQGRILMALRTPAADTPLQDKLTVLAEIIGKFGILAACFIFTAQVIKYFAINTDTSSSDALNNCADFLVIAVTIVVVAVPEGLPLAVTISLAYSMNKMMKDKNLVRRLDACETMGGATTICSDKTGTLTINEMTVVAGWVFGLSFSEEKKLINEDGDDGKEVQASLSDDCVKLLLEGIAVNSTAYEGINNRTGEPTFVGNQTECALLRLADILTEVRFGDAFPEYSNIRKLKPPVKQYAFTSRRKRMSTAVENDSSRGGGVVLHSKGASETMLGMCTKYMNAEGKVMDLSDEMKAQLLETVEHMACDALRTLTLAVRFADQGDGHDYTEDEHPDLICIGIVGIRDPLRPEVSAAVARCQSAGVTVRMVTGDNQTTAMNIAKSCGILDADGSYVCMEGPAFRRLDDGQKDKVVPHLRVLARSSPIDKLELVKSLQRLGEVVAVTGDGVNDGPALKKADVGFAMGLSGTPVAKEASAIVLMDDNFVSIVNAIKWGRNVFDSIRKFLNFQLTVNFTAILLVFIAILADDDGTADSTPLQPVQLLWINLIMDSFAALALATEPPDETLLTYQPYDRDEPLMTPYMWRKMITQIIFQTATFLTILFAGDSWFDSEKEPGDNSEGQFSRRHYTIIFNTFVLSQLVNQINARKIRPKLNVFSGLQNHMIFSAVWLFALVVQILIVEVGGDALKVERLNGDQWLWCIGLSFLPLVWGFGLNLLPHAYLNSPMFWQKPKEQVAVDKAGSRREAFELAEYAASAKKRVEEQKE